MATPRWILGYDESGWVTEERILEPKDDRIPSDYPLTFELCRVNLSSSRDVESVVRWSSFVLGAQQ
jgi:hypothetical protein